jgi:hypothetical protein
MRGIEPGIPNRPPRRFLTLIQGLWLIIVRLFPRELSMKQIIVVGLAIFAVSTSSALAAKKQKAAAAAPVAASAGPMMGQPSAADMALYKKGQAESGMAKKK